MTDDIIEWERISEDGHCVLDRAPVPGGWLVRTLAAAGTGYQKVFKDITYIPDESMTWLHKKVK